MAQLDFGDESSDDDRNAARNIPHRGAARRRNPYPRNPPARGAAQAVRNHERARGGGRRRQQAGGVNQQDLEQRQQAEIQRFLAMAQRDEEEGWDSDELGNDDDDFVIPRR